MKHAVLGLLVERRGYGHELVGRLGDRLGPAFAVPPGTVYASLRALEDDGHIEVVKRIDRGKQTRVYYGTTAAGVDHFERWLDEPLSREPLRGELYLRFALVDERRVPRLRAAFERLELECVSELARHARGRDLADELSDHVSLSTATRWLLDSGAVDRLNADLQFVSRTLAVLRWAEAEGAIPRARLLEAVPSPS